MTDIGQQRRHQHGHWKRSHRRHRRYEPEAPARPWKPRVSPIDRAIEFLMIALLAFSPFAYGVVAAWSEAVFLAIVSAMGICVALKFSLQKDAKIIWSWTYAPIALFIGLALGQCVQLPPGLLRLISPASAALRVRLLGEQASGLATISFYPNATFHDLRLVLAVSVIFFTVVNCCRHSGQIRRLMRMVIVIGSAVLILALAQDITGARNIYWIGPPGRFRANAGPFLTYNHFGQFANLFAGVVMALLLAQIARIYEKRGFETVDLIHQWRERKLRPVWRLGCLMLLACATVFLSQSRGALVGMGCGFALATLLLATATDLSGMGWAMFPLLLALIAAALCLAPDAYLNRLETLHSADSYSDRWQVLKDLTFAWKKFPLLGTGLGTHEYVYPIFDRSANLALATYAENDYAQLLEETGILGLGLCVAFLGLVIAEGIRMVRCVESRLRMAAVGLGFGLVAILVQSFADFGQHLPAIAAMTAVCCGLLVNLGERARSHQKGPARKSRSDPSAGSVHPRSEVQLFDEEEETVPTILVLEPEAPSVPIPVQPPLAAMKPRFKLSPAQHLWIRWGALAIVAVASVLTLAAANRARLGEGDFKAALALETGLAANNWQDDQNEYYIALLRHASAAAEEDPGNIKYRYALDAYRWHAISRVRDPETGDIILNGNGRAFARKIADDLRQARLLCPTYGPQYSLAGEIEVNVLHDSSGAQDIRSGYFLAQNSPSACGLAAMQDARDGWWDDCAVKFRRFLELSGNFEEAARFLIAQAHRPDIALAIAQGNVDRLTVLAEFPAADDAAKTVIARAKRDRYRQLESECQSDNPPMRDLELLAGDAMENQDYKTAVSCYRQALKADYGNIEMHLGLARAMTKLGELGAAYGEVQTSLRLQPDLPEADAMIKDLRAQLGDKAPD